MTAAGLTLDSAGDLLLGANCFGCGRPGFGLCHRCRRLVESHSCVLTRPDPCPERFPLTATAGPYDAVLQQLVSAHKEHQALALTPLLGDRLSLSVAQLLAETGTEVGEGALILVPMPSAPAAVRERGFDATTAMARQAARRLRQSGMPRIRVSRLLRPARTVDDQAGLSAAERQRNLAGALAIVRSGTLAAGPGDGAPVVVIVDDVVTTGASLSEANRVLTATGARVAGAAVVAATQRTYGSRDE